MGACLGEERMPARLEQMSWGPAEALLFKMALYKVPRLSAFPAWLQLFLTDTEPKCRSLKAGVSTLRRVCRIALDQIVWSKVVIISRERTV